MGADASFRVRHPVFLLGAPRSGTTLLASVLDAHPDVAVSSEPRRVWRYGNDRRSDQLRPEHATPRVVEHVHRHFANLLREQQAERLVEKTPANALRPRFLDAIFPDARFVHITRSGWGAVPSMRAFWLRRATGFDAKQLGKLRRRLGEADLSQLRFYAPELLRRTLSRWSRHQSLYGPHLAGLQAVADELGVLEASAWQWRSCVEQSSTFGRSLPEHRYLEVKLESLGPDTVAEILRFAGLRDSPEVMTCFESGYQADAARRRATLSAEERALVEPYVAPADAWLGYTHDSSPIVEHGGRRP